MPDQRLYYFDKADKKAFAHVGPLLTGKINTHRLKAQWKQLIGLVAVIEQGLAPASRILRKLQAAGEHNELFCALQDLGHIEESIYIFSYAGDEQLQRQVERQLNKTENYNSLIDVVSWGQHGEMRLADRQDQHKKSVLAISR